MAEKVSFQIGLNAEAEGHPVVSDNFDFAENWRESTRQRINLGITTATTHTIALGGVTDARIIAIDVKKPIKIRLEAHTVGDGFTVRGKAIMMVDSKTLIVNNLQAYATPNEATIVVWGT